MWRQGRNQALAVGHPDDSAGEPLRRRKGRSTPRWCCEGLCCWIAPPTHGRQVRRSSSITRVSHLRAKLAKRRALRPGVLGPSACSSCSCRSALSFRTPSDTHALISSLIMSGGGGMTIFGSPRRYIHREEPEQGSPNLAPQGHSLGSVAGCGCALSSMDTAAGPNLRRKCTTMSHGAHLVKPGTSADRTYASSVSSTSTFMRDLHHVNCRCHRSRGTSDLIKPILWCR